MLALLILVFTSARCHCIVEPLNMSDPNDPNTRLLASEYELDESETLPGGLSGHHSQYHLPPSEQLRGVANRIIFSRYYILFYFIMMSLSLTTVVLSLVATSTFNVEPP